MEGEADIAALASTLGTMAGRPVVDKTGLAGSYRVLLTFSRAATFRGPDVAGTSNDGPTMFTAMREQLGLRLEPSKAMIETLVIDRLEPPSEN